MEKKYILIVGLIATITLGQSVRAQTIISANVDEDYASVVKVSGSLVVGMMIGSSIGKSDPQDFRFNSLAGTTTDVCLSAKTRDGQYWAESRFELPGDLVEMSELKPTNGWSFINKLNEYQVSDFAALLRVGEECAINGKAPLAPVQLGTDTSKELRIALNSQRAISANIELNFENGASFSTSCKKPKSGLIRSTAFDINCTFEDISGASGEGNLVVKRRVRTGFRTDTFEILFPAPQ